MKSISLQVVLLVSAVAGISVAQTLQCPENCWCEQFHTIGCYAKGLTQPPPGYWPSVNYLYLNGNNFSQLYDYTFTGFPYVGRLDLSSNALTVVDLKAFVATPNLMYLYLVGNRIHTITWDSTGPPFVHEHIRHIFLENNNIVSLDPNLFAKFSPILYSLYLDNNPLVVQDGEPVLNHPQLSWVYMQNCSKLHAGPGSFSGLPNAERLVLRNSGITAVKTGAFSSTVFWVIALSDNPLESFEVSAVSGIMTSGMIEINDTPLACSCGYESLFWWGFNRVSIYADCGEKQCSFARRENP